MQQRTVEEMNDLYPIVKKYIDKYDYYGLLADGAPRDEFETEAEMISRQIDQDSSVEEIASVMAAVMESTFFNKEKPESFMETAELIHDEISSSGKLSDQDWRWCLVGNIVETHEYGEDHEMKTGSKHFAPGAKVFMAPVRWGDGYERISVIGKPRKKQNYVEVIMRSELIENLRMQRVYKPAVLRRMDRSECHWWGNTDQDRDEIIEYLESRNPEEAENMKKKYWNPSEGTDEG